MAACNNSYLEVTLETWPGIPFAKLDYLFDIVSFRLVRLYREHIRQNSHIDCPGCGCHHLQTNTKNKDEKIGDSQPHYQQNRLRGQNIWTIQSSEPIYEDIERCKLGLQVSNKSVGKAVSGSDVRSSVIYSVITTKEAAKFRPVADINIIR